MEGKVQFEFHEVKHKLLEGGSGGRWEEGINGRGEKGKRRKGDGG